MSTREVNSLPTPSHPPMHSPNISDWFGKCVQDLRSPLANPWSSKEGFLEIASRAAFLALFVIPAVLIGYYITQRWKTETPPPESSPSKRTTIPERVTSLRSPPNSPYKPRKSDKALTEAPPQGGLTPVKRTLVLSPAPISSAPATLKSDREKIIEDTDKIAKAYQNIASNLDLLGSAEEITSFEQLCHGFYETYPVTPLNDPYRKVVNQHWMRLSYLQNNYELLWFHFIAGRRAFLFAALFNGLEEFYKANPSARSNTWAANPYKLSVHLNEEMEKMIPDDTELQALTNSAIQAAIIAFEATIHSKEDQLLQDSASKKSEFVDLLKEKQELDLLKYDVASITYPTYFELKKDSLKKIGSLNAIYVFCKLFPDIKVEILTADEPLCYNPEGTFTLTLGQGDQNQFIYIADPETARI